MIKRLSAGSLLVVLAFAGCGGGHHGPKYKTLPRPALKHTPLKAPSPACVKGSASQHVMGVCLPQPKAGVPQPKPTTTVPAPPQTTTSSTTSFTALERVVFVGSPQGPDFSNNDPVPCSAWGAIRNHAVFAYLKSVEGTGFFDSTAAGMAACAKAQHIPVGGYDFLHVCGVSASAEAQHFVAALRAQGLLGAHTLPPAADAEYGSGSCGGRSWLQTWVDTVYNLDGHVCPIAYTGAWWWQPNIGSFWPTCLNVGLLSWISGYGVSYPFMPSGRSELDLWQFSDHGYNGYSNADISQWYRSGASFAAFVNGGKPPKPPKPPDPYRIYPTVERHFAHGVHGSERKAVSGWDRKGCREPVRRHVCVWTAAQLTDLSGRVWFVAHNYRDKRGHWHAWRHPHWTVPKNQPLGKRFSGMWHRLHPKK